jgi:hypothetical protein
MIDHQFFREPLDELGWPGRVWRLGVGGEQYLHGELLEGRATPAEDARPPTLGRTRSAG